MPPESGRRFESQSFWEQLRQLPWPTSLQLWCRLPRRRCVIAIATMEPGPSSAQRCASCRNTRIVGGRPLATKRVPLGKRRRHRIRTRTPARRTTPKKLADRFTVQLFPGSTFCILDFLPLNLKARRAFPWDHSPGIAAARHSAW